MHVVLIEPCFPKNQREFARALHEVGATVTGIGERPKEALDDELRRWLTHYEQVPSVVDEGAVSEKVRWLQSKLPIDRLEATIEAHILPAAHVREVCAIAGTSSKTAFLCRDKPAMKQVLREGGIACAQSMGSSSRSEICDFVAGVGYPVIIKPPSGAGAAGTARADNDAELDAVLGEMGVDQGASVAVEEFIEGHEGFYDTITINGEVAHDFISHYYPNVLEAMRERFISPQFIATNQVDTAPDYEQVREMGKKVISLLGIETSSTHMEWFFGPKGLKFSEIGCRPPGVGAWDLYGVGNEMDLYREWAVAVTSKSTSQKASRAYAAGIIALRPERDGTIIGYEGIASIENELGQWIIDYHLPRAGEPTQPVEAGYMANAWLRMRHPNYDELRQMLNHVGETVKVRAE
ncbi:MAG: ATP-grasp domain-containing protein [Acidobacteria bacterium]|nr:MAG: ATP-grasp domain-containing protein [Acidobacteriota bacterium]